jgi:putative heme iron utilization protein
MGAGGAGQQEAAAPSASMLPRIGVGSRAVFAFLAKLPPTEQAGCKRKGGPVTDPARAQALRQLLEGQDVAALGTLRNGEPFVSMVPYALLPRGGGLVIHVSSLAAHTRDMTAHPAVSVLVTAERSPNVSPQALARVTLQCEARPCPPEDGDYAGAREAYLSRFPGSADMFGFADFSLFVLAPASLRFVGGFAQAWSMTAESFVTAMSDADTTQ